MMNILDLERELSESLSWRKHELQQAKFLAEKAGDSDRPYLCRAWTLVMYAHCDKFLKEASQSYLRYLQDNPRTGYDYWSIWRAFRAKEIMLSATDGVNFEQVTIVDEIDKSKLIAAISDDSVIESGNFSYKRLRFLTTFVLQIDFAFIEYKAFCTTLKTRRDEIAHGEQSVVQEVSDCTAWHDPTLRLIDGLADGVLSVARNT
jgi:hypothetical protein